MVINAAAIIAAGGAGLRMKQSRPKQFSLLADIPMLIHSIRTFVHVAEITHIVLVVPESYLQYSKELIGQFKLKKIHAVVAGGELRQHSVQIGLSHVPSEIDLVAVHDGARPLVSQDIIVACLYQAHKSGAAIASVPVKDTIKRVTEIGGLIIQSTLDRSRLWQAQTPQAARVALLKKGFSVAAKDGFVATDEASLLEHIGCQVTLVTDSPLNIKITRPADMLIAEALLMKESNILSKQYTMRIGHGYDAHRLVADRPLILAGVTIPHTLGLLGHSDGDTLTHALSDAILGGMAEGDIGLHFPDTDQQYKGVLSLSLLSEVMLLAVKKGYQLVNADITIIAEKPKLSSYLSEMCSNLAAVCRVDVSAINLKATTTEKMGFVGREEGIAAHAVALLQQVP